MCIIIQNNSFLFTTQFFKHIFFILQHRTKMNIDEKKWKRENVGGKFYFFINGDIEE